MNIIKSNISTEINGGFLDYSMYTLQNRAIPSAIDGFKPSARKLVYSMLEDYSTKKVKVAELAGSISKYGFHHGESSAEGAIITLTADWNNNCPVFTGHGNFGSRLIQESAAARYIFVSLSPEFKRYFIDTDVAPISTNDENPEPAHYLPTIPWVLVNGISGIAVGFACNILPRSVDSLVSAVKLYLKNPDLFMQKNQPLVPSFPNFTGKIASDPENPMAWKTHGVIEYTGKYTYEITELPIGYDRETYVTLLNDMIEAEKIKNYDDNCSEAGFGFTVKVSAANKEKIDQDPLKYFKLTKSHTENLTTLGTDGKLKIFNSVCELIQYFCDYRLSKFLTKIKFEEKNLMQELLVLKDRVRWVNLVANGSVGFKQHTRDSLLQLVADKITTAEHGKKFINIPLYECTQEYIGQLEEKIIEITAKLDQLKSTTALSRYVDVLK